MSEIILGIADGAHDTGAALIKDGRLALAINEERLSRTKRESRSPISSVNWILDQETNIDAIAVTANPPTLLRSLKIEGKRAINSNLSIKSLLQKFYNNYRNPDENIERLAEKLSKYTAMGDKKNIIGKIKSYDHHKAHAASAYYTSPWDSATALTMDAAGDGISSAVYNCRNGSIERIHANDNVDSLGMTWAALPTVFGFKGARHAGKFMGLAEYADEYPESLRIKMKDIISVDGMKIYNDFRRSRICGSSYEDRVLKLKQMFGEYSAAEVSYALQRRTEEIVGRFAQAAVDNTGCPNVVVAGGIFANVKVNQVIYETDVVDGIWVHPNMGDGGLGAGAAFLASDKATPQQLDDVYLGPKYDTEAIDEAIEAYGLSNKYKHSVFDSTAQMAEEAAKILKQGGVVSYYRDRMEYGPRALGNRSILHRPDDPDAIDWLNKRLDRTEFMPFAPVTLYEHAEECYEGYEPENCPASEFMTITFNCTDKMAERSPGVVHKDKTARPQILRKEVNEPYYRILKEFEKQTGIPTLINTSFNVHGEPIVCDPIEAIESFVNTDNEALIMENRIIRKNHEYQN